MTEPPTLRTPPWRADLAEISEEIGGAYETGKLDHHLYKILTALVALLVRQWRLHDQTALQVILAVAQLEGTHIEDPLSPFVGDEVISRAEVLKVLEAFVRS